MVQLGLRFILQKAIPKRAHTGIYAGKGIMMGHVETFSGKKTKRSWKPNVQRKKYYSEVLEKTVSYNFTTHAMRCIDKAGGFDNYILNTKDSKLHSRAAIDLKKLMNKVLVCKNEGMEIDEIKVKVFPQPKVSCHQYIPKDYTDSFYFDWRGRKQIVHC
ncbi:uncharacterized protein LOC116309048 [Actinia tenebrosa]|uniref:Large ribosomal subunit protein bL28m n=1 Tax=Actinia tenebrosa TaxID=6105 RepID=A0A6P8J6L3_ACTTE|nr:uncharacterized protein LOC116309048 [Actinia tenebrosa]